MHTSMKTLTFEDGTTIEISNHDYEHLKQQMLGDEQSGEQNKSAMPWRGAYGEEYWSVSAGRTVLPYTESDDRIDYYRYAIGNYYRTREEAQHGAEWWQAYGRVRLAILEANDGWTPDWGENGGVKWYISYYCPNGTLNIEASSLFQREAWLPEIKDKITAMHIIDNYEQDLRTIFGV